MSLIKWPLYNISATKTGLREVNEACLLLIMWRGDLGRVVMGRMTGRWKTPAASSWEKTQLERLTPDTAAVPAAEWLWSCVL